MAHVMATDCKNQFTFAAFRESCGTLVPKWKLGNEPSIAQKGDVIDF